MAAQKKKTVKKSSKSKVEQKKETSQPDSYFITMMVGYLVLLAGIVLLLGCITISVGGEKNWLGLYFGGAYPNFMTFLFGRVAVVLFTASLILWGLFIAIASLRPKLLRFAIGTSLLTVDLSFLMSLKNFDVAHATKEQISMNGGVLGQFFLQNLAIPLFGRVSYMAPLILLLFAFVLILVLSFGMRPRHFRFIAQTMRYVRGVFGQRRSLAPVEIETFELPSIGEKKEAEKKPLRRGVVMEDETLMFVPDDVKMRRRGKVEPFNARHNWLTDVLDVSRSDLETRVPNETLGNRLYGAAGNTQKIPAVGNATIADPRNMQTAAVGNGLNDDATFTEDPEIRRLEEELRLNERHMNALQIVEIKERIAAIRRAREVIDWEKGHRGRMQVKGDVRRNADAYKVDQDASRRDRFGFR